MYVTGRQDIMQMLITHKLIIIAQDWAKLTVSSYSSLNFDKVILHPDHVMEKEVVCRIDPTKT